MLSGRVRERAGVYILGVRGSERGRECREEKAGGRKGIEGGSEGGRKELKKKGVRIWMP